MSAKQDPAGEPFKVAEQEHRTAARGGFLVVRVDGKAFHTYLAMSRHQPARGPAYFDARVCHLDNVTEVREYLRWRYLDALRNSVSATAHASFGRARLHGAPVPEQKAMLRDAGVPWEDSPSEWQAGIVAQPITSPETVTYVDKRTRESHSTEALRTRWVTQPMVSFSIKTWDRTPRRALTEAGLLDRDNPDVAERLRALARSFEKPRVE